MMMWSVTKRLQYQSDRDQKVDNLISVLGLQNTYNSKEPSVPTSMPTSKPTNLIIEKFFAETPKPVVQEQQHYQEKPQIPETSSAANHPTVSGYSSTDVSIEKIFYSGPKKS